MLEIALLAAGGWFGLEEGGAGDVAGVGLWMGFAICGLEIFGVSFVLWGGTCFKWPFLRF